MKMMAADDREAVVGRSAYQQDYTTCNQPMHAVL
jgi:hypothetical protein